MERNEYLKLRENNSIELFYEYYKEKVDRNKHRFLEADEFFQSIVRWPPVNDVYGAVLAYYDVKFNVMKVEDVKTGELLKVY